MPYTNTVLLSTASLSQISLQHIRALALFASMLIYAMFGSPTPDHFGLAELIIAGCLIFSVGAGVYHLCPTRHGAAKASYIRAGQALFVFGITIPFMMALFSGLPLARALRDLIPFGFLLLPILLSDVLKERERGFILCFLGLGLIFALRSFEQSIMSLLPFLGSGDYLFYLANSPAVLFTAIFCFGLAAEYFRFLSLRHIIFGLCALVVSFVCVAAR